MKHLHSRLLFAIALLMLGAALLPSCALFSTAPKSVQEFNDMTDQEFNTWTGAVTTTADTASTIALDVSDRAREDLERLCAILDGSTLIPHGHDWLTPFVPQMLLEIQTMLNERGDLSMARMALVLDSIVLGVRQALDRPAQEN